LQALAIYKYSTFDVRTITIDGEPWFVLKDVCNVLGIAKPENVSARLDEDEKGTCQMGTPGGNQTMTIINEPGLYNVILRSDKPEAKPFKRWVTHEVLPSIRKHGGYLTDTLVNTAALSPELQMFKSIFDAVAKTQLEQAEVKKQLVLTTEKVEAQQTVIANIKEAIVERDDDWRKWINNMFNKAVMHTHSKNYQVIRSETYEILEQRAHCDLGRRLSNLKSRLEESGATKTSIKNTTKLDVIEADVKLKEIYTSIIKEFAVRYVA